MCGVSMIKNIVFDLGGVLVDFNPQKRLAYHFEEKYHDLIFQNVYNSAEWKAMDKGTLTLEEAYEAMCSRLPSEFHEKVRCIVFNHEDEMPPIDEMYPIVRSLKENGYNLYLLSNCPDWFDSYKKSVPACDFFDGFIISACYNQSKPDKDIYYTLFNEFNLKADECFFIDDSKANTDAAENIGMKSFCFVQRDFEKLKTEMRKNNINI